MTDFVDAIREYLPIALRSVWIIGLSALVGYFIGSINPASIIARVRGVDLSSQGSGNPGATNAGRIMGWRTGVVVGLLDIAKGYVPVLLVRYVAGDVAALVAGLFAVLGHVSSPWLKGRGGKGVATSLGVILAVRPIWAAPILVVFAVVVATTRNVGLASVAAAVALVPTSIFLHLSAADVAFAVALTTLICVRHYRNLRALAEAASHRADHPAAESASPTSISDPD